MTNITHLPQFTGVTLFHGTKNTICKFNFLMNINLKMKMISCFHFDTSIFAFQ